MANNGESSSRSISMSSGDIPVDFDDSEKSSSDIVIDGNGDDHHDHHDDEIDERAVGCCDDDCRTNSSGSISRDQSNDNITSQDSSNSNHLSKAGDSKRHNPLSILAAKLFDEKVPLKKKLKWLNRIATVKNDGTVQFEVPGDIKTPSLDLGNGVATDETAEVEQLDSAEILDLPPMQIVMLIVGTRGDVQPFVAIGKRLQEYGHRVRLATHRNFKEFVLASGLEFFPLGGDPKILAG